MYPSYFRYHPMPSNLFIKNRSKLLEKLPAGSIAIFHTAEQLSSAFIPKQSSNFFYLTGLERLEAVLLLFKEKATSYLFIALPSAEEQQWTGKGFTEESVAASTGVDQIYPLEELSLFLQKYLPQQEKIYLNTSPIFGHKYKWETYQNKAVRHLYHLQQSYPYHQYCSVQPLLKQLRMYKEPEELMMLQKAAKITANAFYAICNLIRPGMREHFIEASLAHTILSQGGDGFSFSPIVATGKNTTTLHYTYNSQIGTAGMLLLVDAGAAYGHYSADATRVFPIGGKFTSRQRAVYQAVHTLLLRFQKAMRPGVTLAALEQQMATWVTESLINLGVLTSEEVAAQDPKKPSYRKYFMHRTSHHLGLDAHDLADDQIPLSEGMVLTIEPGIYLPLEEIGIRLENTVYIGKEEVSDLFCFPLAHQQIEQLLHKD